MGKLGKAFLFLLAVMLLLTAVSRAAAAFTVAQVQVEQPQSRKIVHTVTGNGIVEKMGEIPVYVVENVLVAEVRVKNGQTVKKGDVLARLDMDSIKEEIKTLENEIETLNLQNQALDAQQRRAEGARRKAKERAEEDYDNTALENQMEQEAAARAVEEAKQQLADAIELVIKQRESTYQKTLEDLQAAEAAAKKAYDDAKELAEGEILQAQRTLEDAAKMPAEDYSAQILQIQINQKQSQLNELYRQKREGQEGLEEQIYLLENEIATLRLQLWGDQNADRRQEEERKTAYRRAQEDYGNTVKRCDRLVEEAKKAWRDAQQKLKEFLEGDTEDIEDDPSVKAAKKALETAEQQESELAYTQGLKEQQARRNLEDAAEAGSTDNMAAINRIVIAEKQWKLEKLVKERDSGGSIVAQMDETVTQVQIVAGQRTTETAAFLMSDTAGGMLFTTQISKEDAMYVTAEDTVTLKSAGTSYEEFSILSLTMNEDETVNVTVYVPKDTLALGAYAGMELTKQSAEYGITVPLSAIHTENERNFVYVMLPEDTVLGGQYMAQRMDVTVAEKNGIYAAISESSLTAESQVIVDSDRMISAGETVRLSEE